jgi:hypothetical protein
MLLLILFPGCRVLEPDQHWHCAALCPGDTVVPRLVELLARCCNVVFEKIAPSLTLFTFEAGTLGSGPGKLLGRHPTSQQDNVATQLLHSHP